MRIAIVEDDDQLLASLKVLLEGEPDIQVIATFNNGGDAIASIPTMDVNILLIDIGLPDISGIELTHQFKQKYPSIDIMIFSVYFDQETVFAALRAGATAYITKGCTPRELIEALHDLQRGGSPMSPKIARQVISAFHNEKIPSEQNLLTQREKNVLIEIEKGKSYKEVASKLSISPHTVNSHIKKIYEKLHSHNRQEALQKAQQKGII